MQTSASLSHAVDLLLVAPRVPNALRVATAGAQRRHAACFANEYAVIYKTSFSITSAPQLSLHSVLQNLVISMFYLIICYLSSAASVLSTATFGSCDADCFVGTVLEVVVPSDARLFNPILTGEQYRVDDSRRRDANPFDVCH